MKFLFLRGSKEYIDSKKQWCLIRRWFGIILIIIAVCLCTRDDIQQGYDKMINQMLCGYQGFYGREELQIMITDEHGYGRLFQSGKCAEVSGDLLFEFPEVYSKRQIRIGNGNWQLLTSYSVRLHADVLKKYGKRCNIFFKAYDNEEQVWKERSYCFCYVRMALVDTENAK